MALCLILLLSALPAPESLPGPHQANASNYRPSTPGVVDDLVGLNSTGDSKILALDVSSNGQSWASCVAFNGSISVVGSTFNARGYDDVLVLGGSSPFDATWATQLRSTNDVVCWDVKLLSSGDVAMVGEFTGSLSIGSSTKYSSGQMDAIVGVYSPSNGAWADSVTFGGAGIDHLYAVQESSSGGLVAIGSSGSDLLNESVATLPASLPNCSTYDCGIVMAYDASLDVDAINVVQSIDDDCDDTGNVRFTDLTPPDASGDFMVVGRFKCTLDFHGSNVTGIESEGGYDGLVVKVDVDLDWGTANRIGGGGIDQLRSIARLGTGFVVHGEFQGSITSNLPTTGSWSMPGSATDLGVLRLSSTSAVQEGVFNGGATYDQARSITVSSTGMVLATGSINNTVTFNGTTVGHLASEGMVLHVLQWDGTNLATDWAIGASTATSGSVSRGQAVAVFGNDLIAWAGYAERWSGSSGTKIGGIPLTGGGTTKTAFLAVVGTDLDVDGVADRSDLCPNDADPSQHDWDGDGLGDACDDDDDEDGVLDDVDTCPRNGTNGWTSSSLTDHDADGCKDYGPENQGLGQDTDDDNDGRTDDVDACPTGEVGWDALNRSLDHDEDGCGDAFVEDEDDDNDGVLDSEDSCTPPETDSMVRTPAVTWLDYDNDGCHDLEDADIDSDGVMNSWDGCNYSTVGFVSSRATDWDSDGCANDDDGDDDNDGIIDDDDECPRGQIQASGEGWKDTDLDGCRDDLEDNDNDNDGILNPNDDCPIGDVGWTSTNLTDFDRDGCRDVGEDDDDDNDDVKDTNDPCGKTPLGAADVDGDGCTGDDDDDWDNDGRDNEVDDCPEGAIGWNSATGGDDHDGDGCRDSDEDKDDDNDGVLDTSDECPEGLTDWNASGNSEVDVDSDGCHRNEDDDDDNDGHVDGVDAFPMDPTEWRDTDSDGTGDNADDDDDNDGWKDNRERECGTDETDDDDTPVDSDDDGTCNALDPDDDNDGVLDGFDFCPGTPFGSPDLDGDGCENNRDTDVDGDGVLNEADDCDNPSNPSLETNWTSLQNRNDLDQDGCKDNTPEDLDRDNDGVSDAVDAFPEDCRYASNLDGDEFPDDINPNLDCSPTPFGPQRKPDGDSDGDGVPDEDEAACGTDPRDASSTPDKPPGSRIGVYCSNQLDDGFLGSFARIFLGSFEDHPGTYVAAFAFILVIVQVLLAFRSGTRNDNRVMPSGGARVIGRDLIDAVGSNVNTGEGNQDTTEDHSNRNEGSGNLAVRNDRNDPNEGIGDVAAAIYGINFETNTGASKRRKGK